MKSIFTALAVLVACIVTCTVASADIGQDLFAVKKSATMNLNTALGLWEIGPFSSDGTSFTLRMKIEQNKVTAANKCTDAAGHSAIVAIEASAVLTPDTLTITGNASNTVTQNGVNCDINIQAGLSKHYSVSNGVMTLEDSPIAASKISD
jgi:hypothetical protein